MLKKFVLAFLLIGVGLMAYLFLYKNVQENPKPFESNSIAQNTTTPIPDNEFVSSNNYTASWIIVRDLDKIDLFSNLPGKLPTYELAVKNSCDSLISGGFYSTEDKLLGLFVSDSNKLNNNTRSDLLNGYFYINKDRSFAITSTVPANEDIRLAIQSGPMLLANGKPIKVISESDENARRIVVAKTKKNEVAFIAIYSKTSSLLGPKLSELPKILDDIQKSKNMKFTEVLNLDGGAHSAFITPDIKLSEVSIIGSYFCVRV